MTFLLKLWFCVWLLVSGIIAALIWTVGVLPLMLQTLVVSGIMVPIMVYLVVPFCRRPWLSSRQEETGVSE